MTVYGWTDAKRGMTNAMRANRLQYVRDEVNARQLGLEGDDPLEISSASVRSGDKTKKLTSTDIFKDDAKYCAGPMLSRVMRNIAAPTRRHRSRPPLGDLARAMMADLGFAFVQSLRYSSTSLRSAASLRRNRPQSAIMVRRFPSMSVRA